ncbi:MAG: MFS transporter [Bdellovibrionaceae bacterium]|nr:MFS transporter [Pseudobdellovibrionaceae bacterium]
MDLTVTKHSSRSDDILLLVGQTLSQVSDRMVQLGLIWFITSGFGERFLIWYLVIGGLPHLLLVKHSGYIIQKISSLRTVLYSDLARGCVYLLAFALISIFPQWLSEKNHSAILWLLFISVFASNIFSAFFNPAILSLSVEIKESDEVQKLTAKLSSINSFATILGPIIGLYIFNAFNLNGLFIIASISYLLSAYALSMVSKAIPNIKKTSITDSTSDSGYLHIFKSHKIIGVMLSVFLIINLMLSPIQILMPSMAKDLFGNSFNSLAIMETFLGVGILIGGAILSVFSIKKHTLFWTWLFLVIMSFAFSAFTYSGQIDLNDITVLGQAMKINFVMSAMCLLILGFTLGMANILILNILQTQPKATDVPTVMSFVNLIGTATLPFSLATLGILQQYFSVAHLGQISGTILVLFVILSYLPFRQYGQEIFK